LTLIYTAEVHGAIEPCGCTSDPLGDISRFATVVGAARKESPAVLLVDAGGLLYPDSGSAARERPADDARAAFLAAALEKLGFAGFGMAESDLVGGPALMRPPRLASNFPPSAAVRAPVVHTVGAGPAAIKVGVLGIADPTLSDRLGAPAEEIGRAARRDADRLRQEGAELVVLLAPVDKALARRIARDAAVDLVILGRQVGAGLPRAEKVVKANGDPAGDGPAAFLLAPADELQRVGRADLVLRAGAGPGLLRDAGGPEATQLRQQEVDHAVARLDADLARWSASGAGAAAGNDAAFIAAKKKERDELIAERARLGAAWVAPRTGSYFTNRLIPLRRILPRDPALVASMKALDLRIAALNRKNPAPPPRAEPGRAAFVGVAGCAKCHAPAVARWNKTVHAAAWKTLVDGKQADYKCIGCHLTGYGQVGGSALGFTKGLEAVQCENCHGPASLHVAAQGLEEPSSVHRSVPETTCVQCHNEHHSDTFQYQSYLRDILGPGHGAAARKQLGDGPTGHGLRAAAVAKAKQAGAATLGKL
jgi:Cytochrome c554 and c-prime